MVAGAEAVPKLKPLPELVVAGVLVAPKLKPVEGALVAVLVAVVLAGVLPKLKPPEGAAAPPPNKLPVVAEVVAGAELAG